VIIVPEGMLVPLIGCPTTSPVKLDTDEMVSSLTVTVPVKDCRVDTTVEPTQGADIVMVKLPALTPVMVCPAGMKPWPPAPIASVMSCPDARPVWGYTQLMILLPEARIAVGVPLTAVAVVELALADSVMVLTPPTEATVVPLGMPVPVTALPTFSPLRLLNAVTMLLPLVRKAVGVTEEMVLDVAVALVDIVMVSPTGSNADTVVEPGMPVPVIGWPTAIPLTLDTDVIIVLPLVTMPVGATVLEAEATAVMVTVPALGLNDEMSPMLGMPVPVRS
jgi:hypothetical protein